MHLWFREMVQQYERSRRRHRPCSSYSLHTYTVLTYVLRSDSPSAVVARLRARDAVSILSGAESNAQAYLDTYRLGPTVPALLASQLALPVLAVPPSRPSILSMRRLWIPGPTRELSCLCCNGRARPHLRRLSRLSRCKSEGAAC